MKKLSLENVNDSRNDILKFLEIYDNTLNIIALCKKNTWEEIISQPAFTCSKLTIK